MTVTPGYLPCVIDPCTGEVLIGSDHVSGLPLSRATALALARRMAEQGECLTPAVARDGGDRWLIEPDDD